MQSRIYHFDHYRIDPTRHEFWDGDERVPLQLKVFECLVYLIEHRDRAVGRDELISAVWGKTDLNDNILSQIIGRARQAVGDSGEQQNVIRTVPRFGYCWVQPVEVVEAELDGSPPKQALSQSSRPRRGAAWGVSLTVLGLVGAALLLLLPERQDASTHEGAALVLPVRVSGDEHPSWIRLGVMDLIAERLREAGLPVVPSDNTVALTSAFDHQKVADTGAIQAAAHAVDASLVVDAMAEAHDRRWEVTLRTVGDGENQASVRGSGADVIAAAADATDRLALSLGLTRARDSEETLSERNQQVRAAVLAGRFDVATELLEHENHDNDLQVRYQMADIDLRAGRFESAQEKFKALIQELPPDAEPALRAQALHGLAFTHIRRLNYELVEPYVIEAMALLDDAEGYQARNTMGELLMARAFIRRIVERDLEAARADYARARIIFDSIGNHLAGARLDANLGMLLRDFGDNPEAIPLLRCAADRLTTFGDVQSELRTRLVLAAAYYWMLDMPSALDQVERFDRLLAQVNEPHLSEQVNLTRIMILDEGGQWAETRRLLARTFRQGDLGGRETKGMWPEYIAARHAYSAGRLEETARYARAALERSWDDVGTPGNLAHTRKLLFCAQLELGQVEAAAGTLAEATEWARDYANSSKVAHHIVLMQAKYALATGDPEAGLALLERAWRQVRTVGAPLEIVRVAQYYVEALIRGGETERASVVFGHVAGWADRSYKAALLQTRLYHALGEPEAWRGALAQAKALAGERKIPSELLEVPGQTGLASYATN